LFGLLGSFIVFKIFKNEESHVHVTDLEDVDDFKVMMFNSKPNYPINEYHCLVFSEDVIDFDEKNLNRMINTAKIWAWNCNHEKKNVYIIFRYSNMNLDESSFRIIKSIFGETKCVFKKIEEASDLFPEVG
jgi:hypothetical protein